MNDLLKFLFLVTTYPLITPILYYKYGIVGFICGLVLSTVYYSVYLYKWHHQANLLYVESNGFFISLMTLLSLIISIILTSHLFSSLNIINTSLMFVNYFTVVFVGALILTLSYV